ncbi:MAG: hypothetical protein OEY98_07345 [Acidimicrobiia bacterium]|nr:hypothetical protein [Acidimicrobiia bacterium]
MMPRVGAVLLVVGLAACTPGGERDVDRSPVGAKATAGAVSITYPPESVALEVGPAELAAAWDERFTDELGAAPALATTSRIEAGAVTDPISLEAVVSSGSVMVAQLALVDGVGDDDQARSASAVRRFLELVLMDNAADVSAAFIGLGFGEEGSLFALREAETEVRSVTFYRASNEDTILIGAVGSP